MNHAAMSVVVTAALVSTAAAQAHLNWQRLLQPPPRTGHALATNPSGQGVVLFGGYGTNDTWVFNGQYWNQTGLWGGPVPRGGHAMALDTSRNVVVLFGGSASNWYGDTWEWNGSRWLLRATTGPAGRSKHAMAYDPIRQRTVLFGGYDGNSSLSDTWEWDGTSWSQYTGWGPSARHGHAMAWDGVGVIVFGGYSSSTPTTGSLVASQTLRFSGAVGSSPSWVDVNPITSPPSDEAIAMVSDGSNHVFMAGGSTYPAALWFWNQTNWAPLSPSPWTPRQATAIAYDNATSTVVLFGGQPPGSLQPLGDTWAGPVTNIAEVHFGPDPRYLAAFAHDSVTNGAILHGGSGSGAPLGDTWSFDGTRWSLATASGPARTDHSIDWDPVQQRLVMFGGADATGPTSSTLAWDRTLQVWFQLTQPVTPTARVGHATTTASGQSAGIYLFGGLSGSAYRDDTWYFDGSTWTNISVGAAPPPRLGAGLAAEPAGSSLLLFGGYDGVAWLSDTWRFDLANRTWTQLLPGQSPPARARHRMVDDPARGIVLTGGTDGTQTFGDCWSWDPAANTWSQTQPPPFAPRWGHSMCMNGSQLVLFGGQNGGLLGDTWALAPRVPAQFVPVGSGCGPATGPLPVLACTHLPYIGEQFTLRVSNLPTSGSPIVLLAFDFSLWPTPWQPCATCSLIVQPVASTTIPNVFGIATLTVPVPANPGLVGAGWHCQSALINSSYPCSFGVGLTNAGRVAVGAQ